MLYRICGGLFLLLFGINYFVSTIPTVVLGVLAILAGVGLLAGI